MFEFLRSFMGWVSESVIQQQLAYGLIMLGYISSIAFYQLIQPTSARLVPAKISRR